MPAYYGIRYYMHPMVTETGTIGLIKSMIYNLFSMRSLTTFSMIGLTTGFFAFFRFNYALLAAIPGTLLVLVAHRHQVHHFGNHCSIMFLAFIWCAGAVNIKYAKFLQIPALKKYLSIALIIVTINFTLLGALGVVNTFIIAANNTFAFQIKNRLTEIKKQIDPEENILVDANYATDMVTTHRNVKALLGFIGNPTTLTSEDIDKTKHVITAAELRKLEKGCDGVKPPANAKSLGLQYNYSSFYDVCFWIGSNKMVAKRYEDSQVTHYYFENK